MHRRTLSIPNSNPAPVEVVTQVQNQTPVQIESQVENTSKECQSSAFTRAALVQDSSVELESRALQGLERGYTRLPNQVLMQLASGNFTRNEIRIVLLIARFTISFRREAAPLSKRVLERQSGLRGAAVLEAVSGLVAKGIVRKTQGDQNRPNLLGLVLPENWDVPGTKDSTQRDKIGTQILPFPKPTYQPNPDQAQAAETTAGRDAHPTPIKDIKQYKTKNSLADVPGKLQEYFADLKPARKHESELRAFESLRKEYEPTDIAACVSLLLNRGARVGKVGSQPCHSPMAYLSKAIEEVLRDVHRLRSVTIIQATQHDHQRSLETEEHRQREASAREFSAKQAAFQAAFPTAEAQDRTVAEMCKHMPFQSAPQVQRIYAIQKWFEQKCAGNPSLSAEIDIEAQNEIL